MSDTISAADQECGWRSGKANSQLIQTLQDDYRFLLVAEGGCLAAEAKDLAIFYSREKRET